MSDESPHQHPEAALAVVNAGAGAARSPAARDALTVLESSLPPGGLEVARTKGPEDLRQALAGLDGRRLVIFGGDGSVHAAISALHELGGLDGVRAVGPIGVVPLGTGNDLARSLGLQVGAPALAARTALEGRPSPVELVVSLGSGEGEDDDEGVVVNAVHAGIGVSAAKRAKTAKKVLRKLAYPAGALAAGIAARPWHLRVVVDGREVHDGRSGVLLVAVNLGSTVGGGARLSPSATPHDGQVDVVVSSATGPLARAGFAVAMARGQHIERHDTATVRGADVLVEAVDGRPFEVNADGDLSQPRTRWHWRCAGDAWQVLVPS
ncbi:Diacylglycerol kinase family enzyme [Quadrisphaera granulorum]|uniref:Diacylglycerol kinase family enzyme n=1 Tax=Quadrisphaera granulorum TaxID=317664 RepID=A0A316AG44_9ACTN|nr:diacylglycerol kinase family protein [Quadrisphaera granulorum]PWJ55884.1 diacylglycerol kinase family enzyme [Quadrisphaera granulorum]SZE95381.1 Diacylglycerol kinase family enzyme [Quadrisphaera granulorum]